VLLLGGCETAQRAAERCDVEAEKWIVLDAPPAHAAALRRAAEADRLHHVERWFEGNDGALLLCQLPRSNAATERSLGLGCGSERWTFHRVTSGWREPEYHLVS